MAKLELSFKRIEIDQAAKMVLGVLLVSAIVTSFALAGAIALFKQARYQNNVIDAKKQAVRQLNANTQAVGSLVDAYKAFDSSAESIIGTNERNSKIVLDALPSKYDFPALATSLEKIAGGHTIRGISGNDDEVAQNSQEGTGTAPTPVEIPFEIGVTTSYKGAQTLIQDFERSIRPLHIRVIELSGSDANLSVNITAKTYYLPETTMRINTKVIQ